MYCKRPQSRAIYALRPCYQQSHVYVWGGVIRSTYCGLNPNRTKICVSDLCAHNNQMQVKVDTRKSMFKIVANYLGHTFFTPSSFVENDQDPFLKMSTRKLGKHYLE